MSPARGRQEMCAGGKINLRTVTNSAILSTKWSNRRSDQPLKKERLVDSMIDQNGLPTTVSWSGDVTDADKHAILQTPEQPTVSFSSLLAQYLSRFAAAAHVLIDPVQRIFFAALDGTAIGTVLSQGDKKTLTIKPVADQTGRSLAWEQTARESGFPAQLGDALKAVVDAPEERPKYRVESLLAALLRAVPEGYQVGNSVPMIEVDQASGSVKVHYFTDARNEAQASLASQSGDEGESGAFVTLEDPTGGGGDAPLVFEGGET